MTDTAVANDFVQFNNFEKSFDTPSGSVTALRDLNLNIQEGQFVAIVGPSGCGKSTLLLALAGLTQPTNGDVLLAGNKVTEPVTRSGIVFQGAELLNWRTAVENILLQVEIRKKPVNEYRDKAKALLADIGLQGFEDHYPDQLSGGMQQRVALCRALLHDPEILLMDEPLGALDAITRDQVQMDLQHIWMRSRKTVVFITHSIEEAVFLADRVVLLSPRPAQIAADVEIELPRPRQVADRGSEAMFGYVNHLRDEFAKLGVFENTERHQDRLGASKLREETS